MILEKVTKENLKEVISLRLDHSQSDLVSSNVVSMAEASVNPDYQPRVAVVNDEIVGFVMYTEWINAKWMIAQRPKEFYIFRVMTGSDYQGRGFGRRMMEALLSEIMHKEPKAIHIGYSEENVIARNLYKSLGFVEYGYFDWGDKAAKIVL